MTIKLQSRDVAPLSMRAAVGSVDVAKRTAEVVFSTGAAVLRSTWMDGPFYEVLDMSPAACRLDRLNSGAPFLQNHDGYDVARTLGVVEAARLEGGKGYATIRFAAEGIDPNADMVFKKVADGVIRSVSVGYRVHKTEKTQTEGDKIPTMTARDWTPYEISAVAIPADAGAGFRSDVPMNTCEVLSHGEPKMTEEEKRAAEAKKAQVAADLERAVQLEAKRDAEIAERAMVTERTRAAGIRHAVKTAKLGDAFAEKLITEGKSLDTSRALVIEELSKRGDDTAIDSNHSGIERGEDARDKWVEGATAGMLSRSGMLPMLATVVAGVKANKIVVPGVRDQFSSFNPDANGGEFRRFSLFECAQDSLARVGVNTRGWSKERIVGEALTRVAGAATISDFAVVLENVMYKTLLGSYALMDDSWRRFCGVDSVQDFRPSNRYRTGSFGVLDLKPEGGEYKRKAIPDGAKLSITTQTYGNTHAVSREAIINDDMGAITDTMNKFGRAAGLSIEKAVFDLLALNGGLGPTITYNGATAALCDDTAFGNVSTGSALSMAALEADRVKMANQKDISANEFLALRPRAMLVPISIEGEANLINRAKFDPTAASAFERPNIVGGLFRDVIGSPRITGTRRYLFAEGVDALLVVFLNGSQAPFMDQKLGWNVDGTEMKVRIDFKAQGFDPKGILTNAGV